MPGITISRRGLTMAIVISLAAIPLLWWTGGGESSSAPTDTTEIGTDASAAAGGTSDESSTAAGAADALGSLSGAFLNPEEIPVLADSEQPETDADRRVIAVPRTRATSRTGWATFRSTITGVRNCAVTGIPFGSPVRITNVNNGRSVDCRATVSALGSAADVILHTDQFAQIAALANAPVPVRIDW